MKRLLNFLRWPNVTIQYKSGRRVRLFLSEYKFTRFRDGRLEFEWKTTGPKPIHINLDEVESIYETR